MKNSSIISQGGGEESAVNSYLRLILTAGVPASFFLLVLQV